MRKTIIANSEKSYAQLLREMRQAFDSAKYISVKIDTGRQRTNQEQKAIEVFCRELADMLNGHGLDIQGVLKEKQVSVPWSQETVKECIYKPIVLAMTGKESTVDLERGQCSRVRDILNRHFVELFGLECPEWPSKDRDNA